MSLAAVQTALPTKDAGSPQKNYSPAPTLPANDERQMQFIDLKAQQALIRDKIEARLMAVLDHGAYIAGPEIEQLEAELAAFTGAADVVAVGSGTQALTIPMMALGVGQGDAVFVPAFTYNATANAVLRVGATPIFVDVQPHTFNMDPVDLARRIDEARAAGLKPRAVVPVDLFGLPADYATIADICAADDLILIGDAAQSFGGRQNGRWVGNIAPITGTSFFPAKALGCYGDGGAIFVRDTEMGEVLRSIRWHGTDAHKRESVRVGINGRLDTMQAAILLEKLAIFEDELQRRREIAAVYEREVRPLCDPFSPPAGSESGWGLYTVAIDDRDGVRARMQEAGVPTAIYYSQPLHRMGAFADYQVAGGLPVCERMAARVLSLPVHPYLSDADVERVVDTFVKALRA